MSGVSDIASLSSSLPSTSQMLGAGRAKMAQNLKSREIDNTAQDFTAMFLSQMIQPMFETVKTNDFFGGGHGEDAMKSFLIQEYGKTLAQTDRSGLTDAIKAELIKMQGDAQDQLLTPSHANEVTG